MNVRVIAALLAASLTLAACNGSNNTPASPSISNISGDYSGTMQDAQLGSGTAAGTLAQHGASAGGQITETASGGPQNFQFSLAIDASNNLTGAIVIDEANGTTCTFSTSGTYNTGTNVISGSYTAVTNCSGDTGTYTLTQQCFDTVTSLHRRTTLGVRKC